MLRIIREVRPQFAFVENVAAILSRGAARVFGDLAEIGYNAIADVFPDPSGLTEGERWFCLAADKSQHGEARMGGGWSYEKTNGKASDREYQEIPIRLGMESLARAGGMVDAIPNRVERVEALGNAQVPFQMASAFQILYERIQK
jgi:DNA (cytosine-5)-methyltransferase 1